MLFYGNIHNAQYNNSCENIQKCEHLSLLLLIVVLEQCFNTWNKVQRVGRFGWFVFMVKTKSCVWTIPKNDSIYFSAVFFRGVYVLMFVSEINASSVKRHECLKKKISTLLKRALRLLFLSFLRNVLGAPSTAHRGKERWQPLWVAFAPRISQAWGDVESALNVKVCKLPEMH